MLRIAAAVLVVILAFAGIVGIVYLRLSGDTDEPQPVIVQRLSDQDCQGYLDYLEQLASLGYEGPLVERALPPSIVCDTPHVILPGLPDLALHGIILTPPDGEPKITQKQAIGNRESKAWLVTLRVNPVNFPPESGEPELVWAVWGMSSARRCLVRPGGFQQPCPNYSNSRSKCGVGFVDAYTGGGVTPGFSTNCVNDSSQE